MDVWSLCRQEEGVIKVFGKFQDVVMQKGRENETDKKKETRMY